MERTVFFSFGMEQLKRNVGSNGLKYSWHNYLASGFVNYGKWAESELLP